MIFPNICIIDIKDAFPVHIGQNPFRPDVFIWVNWKGFYFLLDVFFLYRMQWNLCHDGDQQNVVPIHWWSLYTGSITWKIYMYLQVSLRKSSSTAYSSKICWSPVYSACYENNLCKDKFEETILHVLLSGWSVPKGMCRLNLRDVANLGPFIYRIWNWHLCLACANDHI